MHYNYQLSISNIIIYLQYVQHVGQKLFQREINAIGEPTSQVITNWDATRGTPLGQRGATRDKEKSMPVGSPHLRSLLTGMLQEGLL